MQVKTALTTQIEQTPTDKALSRQIWPLAAIGLGLGLAAVWTAFLGYEIVGLLELEF